MDRRVLPENSPEFYVKGRLLSIVYFLIFRKLVIVKFIIVIVWNVLLLTVRMFLLLFLTSQMMRLNISSKEELVSCLLRSLLAYQLRQQETSSKPFNLYTHVHAYTSYKQRNSWRMPELSVSSGLFFTFWRFFLDRVWVVFK